MSNYVLDLFKNFESIVMKLKIIINSYYVIFFTLEVYV
jgi:hypothetical protein